MREQVMVWYLEAGSDLEYYDPAPRVLFQASCDLFIFFLCYSYFFMGYLTFFIVF